MKRFFVSVFCVLSLAIFQKNYADVVQLPDNSSRSISCLLDTYSYVKLKHREHRGLGYDTGYSTLELFLTPSWQSRFQPIFDGRGHVFNNGDLAANLGIAGRVTDPNENFAFGLNLFYDFRKLSTLKTSQAAIGLEFLSNYVDLRINGYLPVSGYSSEVVNRSNTFGGFVDNTFLLNSTARFAFPSADAEIGGYIPTPFEYFSMYVYTGPYYLFKQNAKTISEGNAFGWRAGADFSVTRWFDIGGEYTYDRIFNSRFVGYVSLNIPLGRWKSQDKKACKTFAKGMNLKTQKIRRNEIIPMTNKSTQVSMKGVSIVFVDNTGVIGAGLTSSNGEGTFQNPYTNLAVVQNNSQVNDIIYIYPGNGTTQGYDTGLVLKTNQRLQSSSEPLTVNGVFIPPQTSSQPKITNEKGSGLVLATGSIVKGITVTEAKTYGISADNVQNFDVQFCNIIASQNQNGAFLDNITGDFTISRNTFSTAASSSGSAIAIGKVTGNRGLMKIENNTINSGFKNGLYYNDTTGSNAVGLDLNFNNNTVQLASGHGINIEKLPGVSTLEFVGNTITSPNTILIKNPNTLNSDTSIEIRNNTLSGKNSALEIKETYGDAYRIILADNVASFKGDNKKTPFLVQLENTGDSSVIMSRNHMTDDSTNSSEPSVKIAYQIPMNLLNSGANIVEYKNNRVTSTSKNITAFKLDFEGDIETIKTEIHDNISRTNSKGFVINQENIGPDICFDFRRNTAKSMKITVPVGNSFGVISKDGTEDGFKDLNPGIKNFDLSPNLTPSNYVKKCSQ